MINVSIVMTNKPAGFKEALAKYLLSMKAKGALCEVEPPSLVPYHTSVRRCWRVKQTNPAQVGCMVAHSYTNETGDVYYLTLVATGPRRDLFEQLLRDNAPFSVSTRYIQNEAGKLLQVVGLDITVHHEPDTIVTQIKKGV